MKQRDESLRRIVELALAEDLGAAGDITSQAIFPPEQRGAAAIVTREDCTMSGLDPAAEVCAQVGDSLTWLPLVEDGQQVPAGAQIGRLEGPVILILASERTLLNFLSHLSGVATLTRKAVEALAGLNTRVAATRKTMPGLRRLDKEAVAHGGGDRHRMGLYDAVLIKDNHIAAAGGVAEAVAAVRASLGDTAVEVEVDTLSQLEEAISAGADTVLLDNMTPSQVRESVEMASGRVIIEVSGGLNLANLRAFAEAGPDLVSLGLLTRDAAGIDFSLEMEAG
jgi:nicotinate-nucleotide pyrophosphorylase (carboxylating)